MARKPKDQTLTEEMRAELKARVLIGEDVHDLALEFNITPAYIGMLVKEEPKKLDQQLHELSKHRPEVIEAVLDNMPEISDNDANTIMDTAKQLDNLKNKNTETAVLISEKLYGIVTNLEDSDAAAYSKLAMITSTLVQLHNGFFKQGTVVQVGGTISNNNLTLIKNGGRV